ncbi:MAG: hypothetical protein AABZ36_00355, partial [Nitrospirota bacterium]
RRVMRCESLLNVREISHNSSNNKKGTTVRFQRIAGATKEKGEVELLVCDNGNGYGEVSVRAVNNTSIWTRKFWLKNGGTTGHQ